MFGNELCTHSNAHVGKLYILLLPLDIDLESISGDQTHFQTYTYIAGMMHVKTLDDWVSMNGASCISFTQSLI